MCGFVGFFDLKRTGNPSYEESLKAMARRLQHRGPDAAGTFSDGDCYLAHQRLSIIDLSEHGKQPMANEDESVWIIYNGETYNFQEIRSRFSLDSQGHKFVSRSDTEVLIHLYEELGPEFVKELNGMFAFALWDKKEKSLYLARDPYGIKPLFYMQSGDCFCFGSEIKALLAFPEYNPQPSLEGLYHFLGFDYVPNSLTSFEGIRELRPGHMLKISLANPEPVITRFFDIDYNVDHKMTEKEALSLSLEMLTKAVERQLISDVPVGVMLSGGIDSSALTALMAKIRGNSDFHTFSLAFEDESFNEGPYAKIVADEIGTEHHEVLVTASKVRELLPKYLTYIDEPYADGSAIPTYLLAQCAKEFITVLLSGEGGDEFFAGYDTYAAYKVRKMYRSVVPGFIRKGIIRPLVNSLPVSHKKLSFEFKAKRFTSGAELPVAESHFSWRAVLTEDMKRQVLTGLERFDGFHPSNQFFLDAFNHCGAKDDLNRLMYLEYSYHLPDDLMIKNDRMTMAHSLEARVPFTDNELVQFLASVPVKHKMKGMHKKHLLRTSLKGYLPDVILEKKKVGLEMPYSRWFRSEIRDIAEDMFSESRLKNTGLFNPAGVRALWQEHLDMQHDHGRFLWGMLNYMLWHDVYIDKKNVSDYLSAPRKARDFSDQINQN